MRPCIVLNDFNRGGAERLVKDLVVRLGGVDGIDPIVVVANERGALRSEFVGEDIEYVSLDVDIAPTTVPSAVSSLTSSLRAIDPDIVHSHLSFSDLVSRLACARLSIPHVSTYHNVRQKRTRPKRVAERLTWRLSDRIVCVSEGVRQSYDGRDTTEVIYNAIDVEGFNARVAAIGDRAVLTGSDANTVYVNVARCVAVKRQQDLIEAIALMDSDDVHLLIVGDGPKRPMLESTVAERGVSDRVTITGYVESIEPYYAIADVFVSSSSREGLPTTHIEAMAAELPIVSTDIPGVRELVEPGGSGYLCPVGRPDTLARTLDTVERAELASLGARGYEIARTQFSLGKMAEDHVSLYRRLVNARDEHR